MHILVSGSLAYDYIMDFPDSFQNHILPDQIHILNICFLVEKLQKNFGGTAGNIAYTLGLLQSAPLIVGGLGTDADDYLTRLKKLKLKSSYIKIDKKGLTSSAHITTDKDDNQITAFFPGGLTNELVPKINAIKEKINLTICAPTHKDVMLSHLEDCVKQKIATVFDPGQQVPVFSATELKRAIDQADFLIGNDYETKLIENKTGWDNDQLVKRAGTLITTLGEKGSLIKTSEQTVKIQPCTPKSVEDPTGAGDAYRAGFFSAYVRGFDLPTCGQVGSVTAVYAVEHYGTQNHYFSIQEFEERYFECYREKIKL